uniref:Uncharacterized protein n=1 Tax=Arundo donax TaxID=35708 RepID=A0A0A8ZFM3_ARUDO
MCIQPLKPICNGKITQNFAWNFIPALIPAGITKVTFFFILIIFIEKHAIVITNINFHIWHTKTL